MGGGANSPTGQEGRREGEGGTSQRGAAMELCIGEWAERPGRFSSMDSGGRSLQNQGLESRVIREVSPRTSTRNHHPVTLI